jgi:adenylosuccinate synthase
MNGIDIKPMYESFKGWETNISQIRNYAEMPDEMKNYINHINSYLGVPVKFISNGPGREQIVSI